MKYFNPREKQEPEAFRAWKRQELERLVAKYKGNPNSGRSLYEHLPPSLPRQEEEGISYYSKLELRLALLEEQGYICCFCNKGIDHKPEGQYVAHELADLPEEIEHMRPVHMFPKQALSYDNLAVSCRGQRGTKNETCNASKGRLMLPLTPFEHSCEERIFFTEDGQIQGADEEAEKTIEILNLTAYDEDRAETIAGFIYEFQDEEEMENGYSDNLISREEAEQIVDALSQKDEQGRFRPFCSAVISVLKREIIQTI